MSDWLVTLIGIIFCGRRAIWSRCCQHHQTCRRNPGLTWQADIQLCVTLFILIASVSVSPDNGKISSTCWICFSAEPRVVSASFFFLASKLKHLFVSARPCNLILNNLICTLFSNWHVDLVRQICLVDGIMFSRKRVINPDVRVNSC